VEGGLVVVLFGGGDAACVLGEPQAAAKRRTKRMGSAARKRFRLEPPRWLTDTFLMLDFRLRRSPRWSSADQDYGVPTPMVRLLVTIGHARRSPSRHGTAARDMQARFVS
jgi:hypothetical protein